ncbi:hypothetical protein GCM10027594_33430 [Hymenobacter agri]
MSLQLLLDEPPLAIFYDHVHEWLYADWRGEQNLGSVQEGGSSLLRLLAQQRCHKLLNDNRNVTGMWSEAAAWAGREWFSAMEAAGLRYFAWVYSPNVYSRLSTDLTLQLMESNVVAATFDDVDTASAWLTQM